MGIDIGAAAPAGPGRGLAQLDLNAPARQGDGGRQPRQAAAKVLAARPAGRLAAPRLMGAVYSRILSKTEADGWAPPRRRASLGKGELLWILVRRGLLA